MTFWVGFITGILFMICGGVVAVMVVSQPKKKKSESTAALSTLLAQKAAVYDPKTTHEGLFQAIPEVAEPAAWFNRVLVRIWMEYRGSGFEEKWRDRMNRRFAQIADKPSIVGNIVMENVDFSNATPELQPFKLLPPKAPYEIRAEFDVVYNGGFSCTIRTSVLGVPVSMTVGLEQLSGRVLFICPSGPNPICTLSFRGHPYTKFTVEPAVASRSITRLPSVSRFIVQTITKIVESDACLPNGICFHIPLKTTMSHAGRGLQLSTIRKKRRVLQAEALTRLVKQQHEAASEALASDAIAAAQAVLEQDTSSESVVQPPKNDAVDKHAAKEAKKEAKKELASTKDTGRSHGVFSLLGSAANKVKEARARQLARAQADLERERQKRQRLADERKERERQREEMRTAAREHLRRVQEKQELESTVIAPLEPISKRKNSDPSSSRTVDKNASASTSMAKTTDDWLGSSFNKPWQEAKPSAAETTGRRNSSESKPRPTTKAPSPAEKKAAKNSAEWTSAVPRSSGTRTEGLLSPRSAPESREVESKDDVDPLGGIRVTEGSDDEKIVGKVTEKVVVDVEKVIRVEEGGAVVRDHDHGKDDVRVEQKHVDEKDVVEEDVEKDVEQKHVVEQKVEKDAVHVGQEHVEQKNVVEGEHILEKEQQEHMSVVPVDHPVNDVDHVDVPCQVEEHDHVEEVDAPVHVKEEDSITLHPTSSSDSSIDLELDLEDTEMSAERGPLTFEFGSVSNDVLGSASEDIDLLADSIFGDLAPSVDGGATASALFPGLSGTSKASKASDASAGSKPSGLASRLGKAPPTPPKKVDFRGFDDLLDEEVVLEAGPVRRETRGRANAMQPAAPDHVDIFDDLGSSVDKGGAATSDIFGENLLGSAPVPPKAAQPESTSRKSTFSNLLKRRK